jgi:hypothetical protein
MVANLVTHNPVTSFGIEPIATAIATGVLAYYYFNVYHTTESVVININKTSVPTNAAPQQTMEGPYEKIQTGAFSTNSKQ